jgi:hypothetical protein
MQTKLFHTIVLCGAALGGALGCSGGDEDSGQEQQEVGKGGHAACPSSIAAPIPAAGGAGAGGTTAIGGEAGAPEPAGAGGVAGSEVTPCGGWPPTK